MRALGDMLLRPTLIIFAMIGVYTFFYYAGGVLPGTNWDTIRDGILQFLPWLIPLVGAMSIAYEVGR